MATRNNALINTVEKRVETNTTARMRAGNKTIKIANNLLQFMAADAGLFSLYCKEIVNAAQFDQLPERYSFSRYNSIPTIENGIIKYTSYCYTETIHFDKNTIIGIHSRFVLSKIGLNKPADSIVSHNVHQYVFTNGKQTRHTKQHKDVQVGELKCFKHSQTVLYTLK
jgi:methionine aminopeptidase